MSTTSRHNLAIAKVAADLLAREAQVKATTCLDLLQLFLDADIDQTDGRTLGEYVVTAEGQARQLAERLAEIKTHLLNYKSQARQQQEARLQRESDDLAALQSGLEGHNLLG